MKTRFENGFLSTTVVLRPGGEWEAGDIPVPSLEPNQVLAKVRARAMNFTDIGHPRSDHHGEA